MSDLLQDFNFENVQNGERFKAKLRKKKYCQYMLNRKYERENATSDKEKSIILTNLYLLRLSTGRNDQMRHGAMYIHIAFDEKSLLI